MYYTYELWNPLKAQPFYVGKGKQRGTARFRDHIREAVKFPNKGNKHKNYTICQIIQAGKQPELRIVLSTDIEEEALQKEIELIKQYGRSDLGTGCLTNMTDGGETAPKTVWTDELREQKRQQMSGCGNHMYGRVRTKEERDMISETRRERIKAGLIVIQHSEAHKEKLRLDNPGGRAKAQPILQIDSETGMVLAKYPSAMQAGKALGKSGRNIAPMCGFYKIRRAHGFYWRWANDSDIIDGRLFNIEQLKEERKEFV